MVFQQIISHLPGKTRISGQPQTLLAFSQITRKCDLFSGSSVNFGARFLGNLCSLKFARFIHSVGPNEFEKGMDNGPVDTQENPGFFEGSNRRWGDANTSTGRNFGVFEGLSRRLTNIGTGSRDARPLGRDMNFVKGMMNDRNDNRYGIENNADIVHIKIMRNNTFVTVTDSKGNKKMGASAGCLAEMKGGPKVSKYSAEATAEHVGRVAKSMGLKSVVMKVNGFTFFKRKKLAILSFRDGYTNSRSDQNPIVYIEDTTRKPHNGCRLRKQRRV
ncbi:probable ribosomal protein S11, mitochondrial [Cynara cardunculus var. scolymus]|uniref:probable ribosomal protein S11, mitochondrial n=1 Tax=Cynara cardunculus var. scolymus TaxID=59895 RepID=UPI000D62F95E|nr:probable ribosomal protein S11, mitochondrial [Cynara cardunculus var. scolymus]